MKFRRLDDSTIRCILTEQDMLERGLKIEDFFTDKDKTRGFLESIVKQAQEEIGYEAPSDTLAMQVMPLPHNGVAITFSEQNEDTMQHMLGHIRSVIEEIKENEIDEMIEDICKSEEQDTEQIKAEKKTEKEKKKKTKVFVRTYKFQDLHSLEDFAMAIPSEWNVKSQLFKDTQEEDYYLVIQKGRMSQQKLEQVCVLAQEFSVLQSEQESFVSYCQEHFVCMIKKKAVAVMRELAL